MLSSQASKKNKNNDAAKQKQRERKLSEQQEKKAVEEQEEKKEGKEGMGKMRLGLAICLWWQPAQRTSRQLSSC